MSGKAPDPKAREADYKEIADEAWKNILDEMQKGGPEAEAERVRREAEREEAITAVIREMREKGELPSVKGSAPKKGS